MVLIKVQYDAYNRQFRLQEKEMAHKLEDGATYLLISDVSTAEIVSTQEAKVQPDLSLVMA